MEGWRGGRCVCRVEELKGRQVMGKDRRRRRLRGQGRCDRRERTVMAGRGKENLKNIFIISSYSLHGRVCKMVNKSKERQTFTKCTSKRDNGVTSLASVSSAQYG